MADAADLLLAALDEAGISNELDELLGNTSKHDEKKSTRDTPPLASSSPLKQVRVEEKNPNINLLDTGQMLTQSVTPSATRPIAESNSQHTGSNSQHTGGSHANLAILEKSHDSKQNATELHSFDSSNSAGVSGATVGPTSQNPIVKTEAACVSQTYSSASRGLVSATTRMHVPSCTKKSITRAPVRKMSSVDTSAEKGIASSQKKEPLSAPVKKIPSDPTMDSGLTDGGFGGSSDFDMFSQALMQLQETNMQAAQFEAKVKADKPKPVKKEVQKDTEIKIEPGLDPSSVKSEPATPAPVKAEMSQVDNKTEPPDSFDPVQAFLSGLKTNTDVKPEPTISQPLLAGSQIKMEAKPQPVRIIQTSQPIVSATQPTVIKYVTNSSVGAFSAVKSVFPSMQTNPVSSHVLNSVPSVSSLASGPKAQVPSTSAKSTLLSSVTNPQLRQVIAQAISQNIKSGNQSKPVTIKIVQPSSTKTTFNTITRSGSPITVVRPAASPAQTISAPQGPPQQKTVKVLQTPDGKTIQIVQKVVPQQSLSAPHMIHSASAPNLVSQIALSQNQASIVRPKTVILDSSVGGTKQVVLQPGGGVTRPMIVRQSSVGQGLNVLPSQMIIRPSNHTTTTSYLPPSNSSQVLIQQPGQAYVPSPPLPKPDNGMVSAKVTSKDVSRLWSNADIKLKNLQALNPQRSQSPLTTGPLYQEEEVEVEEEEEELGHAETYAEYMPAKLKIGQRHPDPVVETSSLSSVEAPDVWYKLSIPETVIDYGHLSALQLEAITYACQKHETLLPSGERAGFLIGDGAGVGKGRTVAGIIYENYLLGRKRALWLSVSNDLKVDAERDLGDIGAGKVEVYPLNKFKYAKISSKVNGKVKKGVIFATYSSLIGESTSDSKYKTRLKQLLHWLGKDFDGVIVFDECHKAKNLCPTGSSKPTKTGLTVLELQRNLPKARVVYASATGASEPKNMAYMTRLGLWGPGTPFREFSDFIQAVEKRGVGAMELVAMDMKLRGMYMARQLSFHGVTFKIDEIQVPKDFYHTYNSSVKLWVKARENFQRASELMQAEHRMKKSMWGQFWSAHQRFFKYLCISAKVPHCVRMAREAVKNGKCVVIGLQSTGEARTLEQLEEAGGELTDFVSTAKGVFQTLVEKHFPAPDRSKYDLFGLTSSLFNDSPRSSPTPNNKKRKKEQPAWWNNNKKPKLDEGISSGSGSSSSEEENPAESASEKELSLSESESDKDDSDNDDFNPFGSGSDSDEDPWLKKAKKKKKEKIPKKKPKEKKAKKAKKKKSKKKKADDDSDDEFADIDKQMDRALEAAGLMNKESSQGPWQAKENHSSLPGVDAVDQAIALKQELLDSVEQLGELLPPNTLDELIDQLGGPEYVAEMTGRKGRVVSTDDGSVQYESRSENDTPLEYLNLTEKQRFMDGDKNIAIISEAASSGISLQADRRAVNQRRRVHITLELPWSADRAVQQFGRTHRSNQVSAPEYLFMISELAGERRFASTVAKRLESLGALTHGDRRATETRDLSQFNIDNKYGRAALESVMKSVLGIERPVVPLPEGYSSNFLEDVKKGCIGVGIISQDNYMSVPVLEKDYNNISKFLNRILGMDVELQNHLFKYFTRTLSFIILEAKRNGRWDMGILDIGSGEENVRLLKTDTFVGTFSGSSAKVHLHMISVERGTSWFKAINIWREHTGQEDGFYISSQPLRNGRRFAILAVALPRKKGKDRLYQVYRPNRGLQLHAETMPEIRKKYKKVLPDDAQPYWEDQYQLSAVQCTHKYNKGSCKKADVGLHCDIGLRTRNYYVLGGSVLSVWNKVETVLTSVPGGMNARMQIIRLRTEDGTRIVGTLIPPNAVDALNTMLKGESNKTYSSHHGNYMPENISMPLLV